MSFLSVRSILLVVTQNKQSCVIQNAASLAGRAWFLCVKQKLGAVVASRVEVTYLGHTSKHHLGGMVAAAGMTAVECLACVQTDPCWQLSTVKHTSNQNAVDELSEVNANAQRDTTVAAQSTGAQTIHSPLTDSGLAMHQHTLASNSVMMHVLAGARRGAPAGQAVDET